MSNELHLPPLGFNAHKHAVAAEFERISFKCISSARCGLATFQVIGIAVQWTNNFVFGAAKPAAQAGSVMRAAILHGIRSFGGTGKTNFFAAQIKHHKGVGLNKIFQFLTRFKYFYPVVGQAPKVKVNN